jgi:hypothetical protein
MDLSQHNYSRQPIIDRFLKTVSWGERCGILEVALWLQFLRYEETWFLPCYFYNIEQIKAELGILLLFTEEDKQQGKVAKKAIIVDGDVAEIDVESIFWLAQKFDFTLFYIQPLPSICHSELICKALEGIDWQRSFQAFCQDGRKAKPVFQWDE